MKNPLISIVIPCFNEEKTIASLLDAIRSQAIDLKLIEVLIADGMSTDRTRDEIKKFSNLHPELSVRILDNEKRVIPYGLNKAIRAAQGEIILRMDAHAMPANDYVALSVAALTEGKGDNVGGVIDIHPGSATNIASAIAVATAHPLGVGDALYRWATKAGYADTVAFGCFYKTMVEKVGYYNESLKANEDYEFNARLRGLGKKIWVDPAIRAIYYSRSTLRALFRQYFSYGYWKVKMLRIFPKTIRWRQALPPLFVLGNLMLLLGSIFWFPAFWIFTAIILTYFAILTSASLKPAIRQNKASLILSVPLAIMTMHFSWGSGFIVSLFRNEKKEI